MILEKFLFKKEISNSNELGGEQRLVFKRRDQTKLEHLKEGEKPIIACVGCPLQFSENRSCLENIDEFLTNPELESRSQVWNVDFYGKLNSIKEFRSAGEGRYAISPLNSMDKFSTGYGCCTGLVVTGRSKETGENISFLSHHRPADFLHGRHKKRFSKDLQKRLKELHERCVGGTIDAAIIGGNYSKESVNSQQDYLGSIKLLSTEISSGLGFDPAVMTGPKMLLGVDDVFYDNNARRLYIIRPKVGDASTQSYLSGDVEKQKNKWL